MALGATAASLTVVRIGERGISMNSDCTLLGAGERLFDGVPGRPLELVAARPASWVIHVTYQITQ
jgi:hypothetical protein